MTKHFIIFSAKTHLAVFKSHWNLSQLALGLVISSEFSTHKTFNLLFFHAALSTKEVFGLEVF